MKSATVDVVLTGNEEAVLNAAMQAVRRGQRVLIVLASGNARVVSSRLRCMCRTENAEDAEVTVMTNAEVVCVDGVNEVEAVVLRDVRTGRLHGVNTSAFVSCDRVRQDVLPNQRGGTRLQHSRPKFYTR